MRFLFLSLTALTTCIGTVISQASFDPDTVPLSTRQSWCDSQITQCPLICVQEEGNTLGTYANDCNATTLTYDCVCSNGLTPNATEYSLTLPYFICTQTNTNCQTNCNGDNTCAAACVQDHPCGAQNPTRVNTSTITTMSATGTSGASAASTQSDGAVYTGFAGSSATASASSDHSGTSAATRVVLNVGQIYGLGVVAAGVCAGLAVLL